ncbi:MAG: TonB family protein, partial [Thermomonas haemolytica]
LAQIGEFSFILAELGVGLKLLPEQGRDLILAGAILSIMLNPAVFAGVGWIKRRLDQGAAAAPAPAAPAAAGGNGGSQAQPTPLSTPPPRYPPEALRMGIGGTVKVRVTVTPDGRVDRLELAETSGNRYLDRAALETVRRWTFRPAMRNGQPVQAEVVVPIQFDPNR